MYLVAQPGFNTRTKLVGFQSHAYPNARGVGTLWQRPGCGGGPSIWKGKERSASGQGFSIRELEARGLGTAEEVRLADFD